MDHRADVDHRFRTLRLAQRHDLLLRQKCRQSGRNRACAAAPQRDRIFRLTERRADLREAVVHHADAGHLQRRRQNAIHGRHAFLCRCFALERNIQQFRVAGNARGQRGSKGHHDMRIKAVGIRNRQSASAQCALHGALQIQQAEMTNDVAFLKLQKHSHRPSHAPSNRLRPQP